MKFARYLQDTQTPEWKRAYIDYRGLKKRIGKLREERENAGPTSSTVNLNEEQTHMRLSLESKDSESQHARPSESSNRPTHPPIQRAQTERPWRPGTSEQRPAHRRGFSNVTRRLFVGSRSTFSGVRQVKPIPFGPLPLHELLPLLESNELAFFNDLDAQLEKVETFYLNREKEMRARSKQLREQLNELADHRKAYHAAQAGSVRLWTGALKSPANVLKVPVSSYVPHFKLYKRHDAIPDSTAVPTSESTPSGSVKGKRKAVADNTTLPEENYETRSKSFDPDEYLNAKKKIKRALLEHYRGVELLHNFRVLNVTGFRKALKKFEKVTKIPAQQAYMTEKIDSSALGSATSVNQMLKEIEDLYAERFENGDKKRAVRRLRTGSQSNNHHSSVFRSGLAIGVAIPAFISGLYQSFQPETRDDIPAFGALLIVYGTLLIPVLFSLLVGLNMMVWSRSRINYQFIFELDTRTRIDYRQYFEIPGILLAGLCYSFWLSFSRIGYPDVDPTIWPVVWLGFVALFILHPLPLFHKTSRYWVIKNISRLLISGTRRVEFTDFWLGDQLCSLTYTLSNLYFVGCMYHKGFDISWQRCLNSKDWAVAFILAALPLIVRLVQSIRRYADSRLSTHLINGGKYASGALSAALYSYWRYQGSTRGRPFVAWCMFQSIYAIYATAWDFLMDWSILKSHATHLLLRDDVIYSNHISFYYIAILTNIVIRFAWIIYIPRGGPSTPIRTFIVAGLEMLRRWQWNFYRLENEHIGNIDQYRATREVPLPYHIEDEAQGEEDEDGNSQRSWLSMKRMSISASNHRQESL